MTATSRMFRSVLSNGALTQSAANDAPRIVDRARGNMQQTKKELDQHRGPMTLSPVSPVGPRSK